MTIAEFADYGCLAVALAVPPFLVYRFDRPGVVWGALTVWGSLIIAGIVLGELDPQSRSPRATPAARLR